MKNHTVYILAGSNIGDRLLNCQKGIAVLTRPGTSVLTDRSHAYITEPVDYKNQDWFVNFAAKIKTALTPFQLLSRLKSIQRDSGRIFDPVESGPRALDLDIIMYDDLVIDSPELTVPHPKMHKRHFVLRPICDIDQKIVHPVLKKDMLYLLNNLNNKGQRVVRYRCDY